MSIEEQKKMKLTRDYLLIVTKDFYARNASINDNVRKHVIERGEIIQFRYQHSAHFRTLKNDEYFVTDEETFCANTEILGKIWSNVEWGNKANLYDIMRLQLFNYDGNIKFLANLNEKYPDWKIINNIKF